MSLKPLPSFKFQKRGYGVPYLQPEMDGKTYKKPKSEDELIYNFIERVRNGSWRPHQLLGADTETLDGKARKISLETTKVTGWNKSRKPTGYAFTGKVVNVNSFMECLNAFIDAGRGYSKKRSVGKGKNKRTWTDRNWMTDQYFFWNLKFDAQAMLKWLLTYKYGGKVSPKHEVILKDLISGKEQWLDRLLALGELILPTGSYEVKTEEGTETVYQWIEITYLEGKWLCFNFNNMFKVKGGKRFKIKDLEMWDISQFYNKLPLTVAAKKNLGEGKMEKCFDGSKLEASRFGEKDVLFTGDTFPYNADDYTVANYWDYYEEDIDKYAVIDAELCGQLARKKCSEYIASGVRFKRAYSPANVAQTHLLDLGFRQTVNLMENDANFKELMRMGQEAYNGGNFDVAAIGLFQDCIQVDLVSAYPYIQYHLPALMRTKKVMKEVKGKEKEVFQDEVVGAIVQGDGENADLFLEWMKERRPYTLGFIEVQMEFPEGQSWYPILEEINGCLTAPRCIDRTITADELKEALLWNPTNITYGKWVFHQEPDKGKQYPFKKSLTRLFDLKYNAPNPTVRAVAKVSANSVYGKNLQAIEDTMGKLWNIGYGAVICGATRARLAEINRLNGKKAISMATDGVIFKREDLVNMPKRPLPAPENLGEWEIDNEGEVFIMGSGLYSFIGEEAEDYDNEWLQGQVAPRTFKTTYRGSAKLFLNESSHNDWKSFARQYASEEVLTTTKSRPKSMKEARMKKDYSLINIFEEQQYRMRPFGDSTKRKCPLRPTTFGDLLTNQYPLVPYESAIEALAYARLRKDIAEVQNYD